METVLPPASFRNLPSITVGCNQGERSIKGTVAREFETAIRERSIKVALAREF